MALTTSGPAVEGSATVLSTAGSAPKGQWPLTTPGPAVEGSATVLSTAGSAPKGQWPLTTSGPAVEGSATVLSTAGSAPKGQWPLTTSGPAVEGSATVLSTAGSAPKGQWSLTTSGPAVEGSATVLSTAGSAPKGQWSFTTPGPAVEGSATVPSTAGQGRSVWQGAMRPVSDRHGSGMTQTAPSVQKARDIDPEARPGDIVVDEDEDGDGDGIERQSLLEAAEERASQAEMALHALRQEYERVARSLAMDGLDTVSSLRRRVDTLTSELKDRSTHDARQQQTRSEAAARYELLQAELELLRHTHAVEKQAAAPLRTLVEKLRRVPGPLCVDAECRARGAEPARFCWGACGCLVYCRACVTKAQAKGRKLACPACRAPADPHHQQLFFQVVFPADRTK